MLQQELYCEIPGYSRAPAQPRMNWRIWTDLKMMELTWAERWNQQLLTEMMASTCGSESTWMLVESRTRVEDMLFSNTAG